MALGSDGNVYTWGDGADGALGNGGTAAANTPVKVTLPGGVTATAIAAERYSAMAIGSNGVLYAWGDNANGELGNGGTTEANSPVTVSMPGGVTATVIAGGGMHSLAIGSNGLLYTWGYNSYGQVGNGTTTDQMSPLQIALPAGINPVAVAGGFLSSYAIGSDGKLYAWGYNGYGQLGNGGTTSGKTPTPVSLPALSLPATNVFSGSTAESAFAIATSIPTPTTTTVGSVGLHGRLRPERHDHGDRGTQRRRWDRRIPERLECRFWLHRSVPHLVGGQRAGPMFDLFPGARLLRLQGHVQRRLDLRRKHLVGHRTDR